MFNKNDLEEIKEIIKEFFKKMTIEVEIEILPLEEVNSLFNKKAAKGPLRPPASPKFQRGERSEASEPRPDGWEEKIFTLPINLRAKEPQILIGEKGQTLLDIQQLLKVILKRKLKKPFFLDLDINNYKKKKIEYLKEMAKTLADEVALTKKEKWLPSMPSYERRIIHLELAERKDVTTESIGQESERKVVIRPYP